MVVSDGKLDLVGILREQHWKFPVIKEKQKKK